MSNFRDVFLRELISNANDALEKFRLTALTEKDIYDGVSPLNVTIKAVKNEDDNGGRIIITGTRLSSRSLGRANKPRYWYRNECGRADEQPGALNLVVLAATKLTLYPGNTCEIRDF